MTVAWIGLGANLGDAAGTVRAAIGVVTPLDGADERRLAPLVVQAAKDLTKTLRGANSH